MANSSIKSNMMMGDICKQEVGGTLWRSINGTAMFLHLSCRVLTVFQCCPSLEWMSILRNKWSHPKRSVWKSFRFFFLFGVRVSLCHSGCPETCFVPHAWIWSDFPVTKDMSVPQPWWLFSILEAEVMQAFSRSFKHGDLRSTQKLHLHVILTWFHMLWIHPQDNQEKWTVRIKNRLGRSHMAPAS